MILFKMNLSLFASETPEGNLNVNVTTATATGNNLSAEMKTYYSDYLIDLAEAELIHDQFAQKHPIPKNGGKTIEFRKYSPLPKALTPLTEGITPNGQSLDVSTITAELRQYGGYITLSDVLLLTAIDNNLVHATKLIASQAGRTLDTVTREVINAGTNVIYSGSKLTRQAVATGGDKLTVDDIRRAVRELKMMNAKRINGSYVAIIHPDVAYDLMNDKRWIDVKTYSDPSGIYEGEIGKIEGVRFIENTEAKIFKKYIDTADGNKEKNLARSVYSTLIIADDAYGTTDVSGGGLQHFVKQLGSAGAADPLNQRATVGWKALKTSKILVDEYLVRIESASTYDGDLN